MTANPTTAPSPPQTQRSRVGALHVVHGVLKLDVGGLERIVLDLIRAGRRLGQRVSVVCVERRGELAAEAERLGADVFCLNKSASRQQQARRDAAALLQRLRPDVVHTHQVGALWYLGQAARSVGRIPVLHTEHGNQLALAAGVWHQLKARFVWHRAARDAACFCCVSEEIARTVTQWHTVPRAKVEMVRNGIDPETFASRSDGPLVRQELGIPAGAPVVGTIGRLTLVKWHELLLRAAATLHGTMPDVHVLLVGDGPERSRLEHVAGVLGIRDRVHFAGYQPRPERFLQVMDVFALTSRSEGLPLAMLEAWAAGRPVVCSAVGGIPQVVTNGKNGLLFPCGDDGALVDALATLFKDPLTADRLGRAGQATVRAEYSVERMAADYERRYRALLVTWEGESHANSGHHKPVPQPLSAAPSAV